MSFTVDNEFLSPADESGRERMHKRIVDRGGELRQGTLAKSILDRPIDVYYVGKGKRYVTVFATHHALESITSNIAYLLIDLLIQKSERGVVNGVDCKLLLSKYCFAIVPCVNPDGVELRYHGAKKTPLYDRQMRMSGGDFSKWQANARGVDLNHNYDFGFTEYKQLERELGIRPGLSLFSGEYPESEPESRAMANLVRTLSPCAVVSLHAQGEEIFAPMKDRRGRRVSEHFASLTGYRLSAPSGTAAYGGLVDYTASLGIPSFTLEVGRGTNPLPESDIPSIFSRVGEALAILPTLL